MLSTKKKLVPPDGGWGWVIVFAYALNHLILVPIMQSFGLIFKDTFADMGFSATDGSIIINTNAACSMLTGLINGPLLKYFGYRKVSIAGAFFTTLGVILTAYATSFVGFLVTYSFVTSLGMGMGMSSYPLALNSYFVKRRSKASGITMTITGLGPVIMPQLISFLMYMYGVRGSMLIIGAVASHSFIAAVLLQPVRWHMIEEVLDDEAPPDDAVKLLKEEAMEKAPQTVLRKTSVNNSMISIDHDLEIQAIYGIDTPLGGSVISLNQNNQNRRPSIASYKVGAQKWSSNLSVNNVNHRHNTHEKLNEEVESTPTAQDNNEVNDKKEVEKEKDKEPESLCGRILANLIRIFDLTLLRDPIYLNIMLGMSFAVFAELNFSLLTPFILGDFNLSTEQIAIFLSTLSIADICFRFFAPFIGDFLNKPARIMYMISLLLLIATRLTLLLFDKYEHLLGVAALLGVAKGIRTVYWTLVIPNYVPIERLANASGIQMVVNGIFILCGGPVLGLIRDVTGSYRNSIYVINIVTLTTVVMWSTELLYLKFKNSKNNKKECDAA